MITNSNRKIDAQIKLKAEKIRLHNSRVQFVQYINDYIHSHPLNIKDLQAINAFKKWIER